MLSFASLVRLFVVRIAVLYSTSDSSASVTISAPLIRRKMDLEESNDASIFNSRPSNGNSLLCSSENTTENSRNNVYWIWTIKIKFVFIYRCLKCHELSVRPGPHHCHELNCIIVWLWKYERKNVLKYKMNRNKSNKLTDVPFIESDASISISTLLLPTRKPNEPNFKIWTSKASTFAHIIWMSACSNCFSMFRTEMAPSAVTRMRSLTMNFCGSVKIRKRLTPSLSATLNRMIPSVSKWNNLTVKPNFCKTTFAPERITGADDSGFSVLPSKIWVNSWLHQNSSAIVVCWTFSTMKSERKSLLVQSLWWPVSWKQTPSQTLQRV